MIFKRSFPSQTFLWFCDSVKCIYVQVYCSFATKNVTVSSFSWSFICKIYIPITYIKPIYLTYIKGYLLDLVFKALHAAVPVYAPMHSSQLERKKHLNTASGIHRLGYLYKSNGGFSWEAGRDLLSELCGYGSLVAGGRACRAWIFEFYRSLKSRIFF